MKPCPLFFLSLVFLGGIANAAKADEPVWLTSACYTFRLSVWDKLHDKEFVAKYKVIAEKGREYVAEKKARDTNSAAVVFPDDFIDTKNGLQAYANCNEGEKYSWSIYTNNVLIDSGTISFARNKKHRA